MHTTIDLNYEMKVYIYTYTHVHVYDHITMLSITMLGPPDMLGMPDRNIEKLKFC